MSGKKFSEMTDEDFQNFEAPEDIAPPPSEDTPPPEEPTVETGEAETNAPENPTPEADEPENQEGQGDQEGDTPEEDPAVPPSGSKPEDKPADGDTPAEAKAEGDAPETPNYEQFYQEIMKPFRANGKEFVLKSPEEARKLMEQGAGYGRKMMQIQPYLKVSKMLEKHGLLDESKLSFLIDVERGDPAAIQKLLKDKQLDPLDFNQDQEAKYQPSNYSVSENEIAFQEQLQALQGSPSGQETIRHIHADWDDESKRVLGQKPEIMALVHQHREAGVYQKVTDEMERQITLGHLNPRLPFLERYSQVEAHLQRLGLFNPPAAQPAPRPNVELGTRVAKPKSDIAPDPRVTAAAPPRQSPRKSTESVNLAKLSDEDFLKQFGDRL